MLPDELVGSLRSVKPQSNLAMERFKSMQRRNVIEPRSSMSRPRRYAMKEFQQRAYKNYDLQESLKAAELAKAEKRAQKKLARQ